VVNAGLELAGRGPLQPLARQDAKRAGVPEAFTVPAADPNGSWASTLDTLRAPRGRDEPLWHWRQGPIKPVVFQAPERITDEVVQLHLAHPLVQRSWLASGPRAGRPTICPGQRCSATTAMPSPE
jgi:hypothetical protein